MLCLIEECTDMRSSANVQASLVIPPVTVCACFSLVLELLVKLADQLKAMLRLKADLFPDLPPYTVHLGALVGMLIIPSLWTLPLEM